MLTLEQSGIFVIDDILTTEEADILMTAAYNTPQTNGLTDVRLWSELYRVGGQYKLQENHPAYPIMKKAQDTTLGWLHNCVALPPLRHHLAGISISSKPFVFHADAVWTETPEDRNYGIPTEIPNDYSTFIDNTDKVWVGNRTPTRVYTSVLYLNTSFDGGETIFPQHKLDITPKAGRAVLFPCGKEHIHGVRPSRNGYRAAFNSWYEKNS
jgi:hypothetical protein